MQRRVFGIRTFSRWFFLYSFDKRELANINAHELKASQAMAKELLTFCDHQLTSGLAGGEFDEICDDNRKR